MPLLTDEIVWGETYDIKAEAKDAAGIIIPFGVGWAAAIRITQGRGPMRGPIVVEPAMTIVSGAVHCSIHTGDAPWVEGEYTYDIRFTDSEGNDYWSDPVALRLLNRNTPSS